jgi:soluble lytic murein transglycosylase
LEIIAAMRSPMRNEATWQYWRAMALMQAQQREQAEEILRDLRDEFGFYGLLAQELLGTAVRLPARLEVSLTAEDQKKLDRDPAIQRSYALVRAGMRAEAVLEWGAAMRQRSDAELIRAAEHARRAGFYDRMIAAADRTHQEHDFSLRYPALFKEKVLSAAQQKSLDPWWVLGLIRQESRFIPDIKSSVGATGLMQIMPATGKMLAKEVGLGSTRPLALTDVELNVNLGTTYLRQLQDRFGGSALLASAAYNAGPSRAVNWRAALPRRIDGAAFAESIPFPETRDYVKRVLANAVLYHAVHNGGAVPSLRRLLGDVAPAESS